MDKKLFSQFAFEPENRDLYIHQPGDDILDYLKNIFSNLTNLMARVRAHNGLYFFSYGLFESLENNKLKLVSLTDRRAMLRMATKRRVPGYLKKVMEAAAPVLIDNREYHSVKLLLKATLSKINQQKQVPIEFLDLVAMKDRLPEYTQSFINFRMKMAIGVPILMNDLSIGILWGVTPIAINDEQKQEIISRLTTLHHAVYYILQSWYDDRMHDAESLGKLIENIDLFFRYDKVFSLDVPTSTVPPRTVIGYSYPFRAKFRTDSDIVIPTARGFSVSLKRYLPEKIKTKNPVLLMIPGFFCNRELMKLLAREMSLRYGYIVFTLDLRGRSPLTLPTEGNSSWTVDDYIMEDFPVTLNWLKIQYPDTEFVVFGHSMGGMIPRFYYSSYKKIIRRSLDVPLPNPNNLIKAVVTITSPSYVDVESTLPGFNAWKKAARAAGKFPITNMLINTLSATISGAMPTISLNQLFQFIHGMGGNVRNLSYSLSRRFLAVKDFIGYRQITTPEWYQVLEDVLCNESIKTIAQFLKSQMSENKAILSYDDTINYTEDQKNFDLPLFTVVGSVDTIAPPDTVISANQMVKSKNIASQSYPQGHLGIIMHPQTVQQIATDTAKWLSEL